MVLSVMCCSLAQGWGENDRGVSYTFGPDSVTEFLQKHDLDLICRAHQVTHACAGWLQCTFVQRCTKQSYVPQLFRLWKKGMSSLRVASWSRYSVRPTTAANLTMLGL